MRNLKSLILLLSLAAFLCPSHVFAWGGIGHRIIAETAAILIQREEPKPAWGGFFSRHRYQLGYYSVLPDLNFRYEDRNEGKTEAPTHFFDIDLLKPLLTQGQLDSHALPADYEKFEKVIKDLKKNNLPGTGEIGSAPWRIEQLHALAANKLKDIKTLRGGYQRGATARGDNRKLYDAMFYLGILSHYTGDATMPYHATSDWNGYLTGNGGIHFFFESDCVDSIDPDLASEVLAKAQSKKDEWLSQWNPAHESVASVMFRVFSDSLQKKEELSSIDRKSALIQPSKVSGAGMQTPAMRKPADEVCKAFKPLLVEQLAKGAVLTFHIWKSVLPQSASAAPPPDLQYSDLQFEPAYIAPNFRQPDSRFFLQHTRGGTSGKSPH